MNELSCDVMNENWSCVSASQHPDLMSCRVLTSEQHWNALIKADQGCSGKININQLVNTIHVLLSI